MTLSQLTERAQEAERAGDVPAALSFYERAFGRLTNEGSAADAANLLRRIGRLHRQRGDLDLAEELFEASRAVAGAAGLRGPLAQAVNCLAVLEQLRGHIDGAERLYRQAAGLADEAEDAPLAAMIAQNLGTLANIRGDLEEARRSYQSALVRFRALGEELGAAWSLNNLGMLHTDLGDWDAAERAFDEAFERADRVQDASTLGSIEINRAELCLKQGDVARARDCCDRAYEIFSLLGSRRWLAETHKAYGILFRDTRKPGLAARHLQDAAELAEAGEDRLVLAETLEAWALLHLEEERNREALQCLNRAHRLFGELHAARDLLDVERRLDDLEGTYLRVVEAWGEAIEGKDRYTAGHCRRVAEYTCMLARAVGITGRDLTWVRMGGYLHDVGKMEVPPEVLNKAGKLTAEEWTLMKAHTTAGDAIVAELEFPWDIRPLVRSHHERWDGSGYPDGLAGEDIPLIARILGVADVYDALTTTRSYRAALSRDEALRIMDKEAGTVLDPDLFALFRELVAGQASPAGRHEPGRRRSALAVA